MNIYVEALFFFILGSCIGSFCTAVSYRMQCGESFVKGRSRCPKCKHVLGAECLVPLFSSLFLRFKCKYCKAKISKRYISIEFFTGLLFTIFYLRFGISVNFLILSCVITCLVIISVVDLESYIIPDSIQLVLLCLAFLYIHYNDIDLIHRLIAGCVYILFILFLYLIFLALRNKEAIGWGDIKFFGVAGLYLGLDKFNLFIMLSGIFGIIIGLLWQKITKEEIFPFGPSLTLSMLILLLF